MNRALFVDNKIFNDCTVRIQQEVFRSKRILYRSILTIIVLL